MKMSKAQEIIYNVVTGLQLMIQTRDMHGLRATGLCSYIYESLVGCDRSLKWNTENLLWSYFESWPLCVWKHYPVPASRSPIHCDGTEYAFEAADEAYHQANTIGMWLDGEYAELRQELLQHILDEIKREVL